MRAGPGLSSSLWCAQAPGDQHSPALDTPTHSLRPRCRAPSAFSIRLQTAAAAASASCGAFTGWSDGAVNSSSIAIVSCVWRWCWWCRHHVVPRQSQTNPKQNVACFRTCRVGIRALQEASPTVKIFVYVHEGVSAEQLQRGVRERFNIELLRPIEVRCICQQGQGEGEQQCGGRRSVNAGRVEDESPTLSTPQRLAACRGRHTSDQL